MTVCSNKVFASAALLTCKVAAHGYLGGPVVVPFRQDNHGNAPTYTEDDFCNLDLVARNMFLHHHWSEVGYQEPNAIDDLEIQLDWFNGFPQNINNGRLLGRTAAQNCNQPDQCPGAASFCPQRPGHNVSIGAGGLGLHTCDQNGNPRNHYSRMFCNYGQLCTMNDGPPSFVHDLLSPGPTRRNSCFRPGDQIDVTYSMIFNHGGQHSVWIKNKADADYDESAENFFGGHGPTNDQTKAVPFTNGNVWKPVMDASRNPQNWYGASSTDQVTLPCDLQDGCYTIAWRWDTNDGVWINLADIEVRRDGNQCGMCNHHSAGSNLNNALDYSCSARRFQERFESRPNSCPQVPDPPTDQEPPTQEPQEPPTEPPTPPSTPPDNGDGGVRPPAEPPTQPPCHGDDMSNHFCPGFCYMVGFLPTNSYEHCMEGCASIFQTTNDEM